MAPSDVLDRLVDERNRPLFDDVAMRAKIVLSPSDRTTWTSFLDRDRSVAEIGFAETAHPKECFTHELLHMELELSGLRKPYFVDEEGVKKELIGHLFNEFAHHKMFPRYVAMGFLPERFLHDSDVRESRAFLEQEVAELEEAASLLGGSPVRGLRLGLAYLFSMSPHDRGMPLSLTVSRLRAIADPAAIAGIDKVLGQWVGTHSLDSRYVFAGFFRACSMLRIGFSLTGKRDDMIVAGDVQL